MPLPPLAERLRPKTLHDLIGQEHLTGKGSVLRNSIENGKIPSMILWGPPGVGKTTIANIIAQTLHVPFYTLSAISSGVKEVREVIEESKKRKMPFCLLTRFTASIKDNRMRCLAQWKKELLL